MLSLSHVLKVREELFGLQIKIVWQNSWFNLEGAWKFWRQLPLRVSHLKSVLAHCHLLCDKNYAVDVLTTHGKP